MPEMKNQFTGGKMNKDLDERLVPRGEYRDAMNIQVSTSEGSEVGTVQNILGNKEVATSLDLGLNAGPATCVGSIADEKNDKVYFFTIDKENPERHMIVEHNVKSGNSVAVFVSFDPTILRFNANNLITGINIIDGMLFWTDGFYEPKKINIARCIAGTPNHNTQTKLINSYQNIALSNNIELQEKHITVVKKSPLKAPFLNMVGERPGNSYGDINYNFAQNAVGDTFDITINPFPSGSNNYQVKDILLVLESTTSFGIFPITSPGYNIRLVINSIAGTVYNCTMLSTTNPIDATATQYYSDIDKSYQKLYELKFPRFAIRYKYEDGEYSSFGPFSEVAFIPGAWDEDTEKVSYMPNTGYNKGMENRLRELTLSKIIPSNIPKDVKQVDILYKESNSPAVYLVDEIKYDDVYWTNDSYTITKENIKSILPDNQILRPWDNVPRSAKAQELTGNRIVYANYKQNYNLDEGTSFRSVLDTSLEDRSTYFSNNNFKSIKSIRDYQVGVVYTDTYNRQTPVLTDTTGALKVNKITSDQQTQIQVVPRHNPPTWATHQKFYVKETASEYYNLSLDRYFDADDNNLWLSFASNDRNKVDLETALYLKKRFNSNDAETTFEKYKIIDIKAEAPEFIKTRRSIIGSEPNSTSHINSTHATTNLFVGPGGMPVNGEQTIRVQKSELKNSLLHDFHVRHNSANYDPATGISSGGGAVVNNPLFIRITFVSDSGSQVNKSDWNEVDNITITDSDPFTSEPGYLIRLKTPFRAVNNWTSIGGNVINDGSQLISSIGAVTGSLALEVGQDVVQNKSMFQGRFFAKIERDIGVTTSLLGAAKFTNLQVVATADCGYLKGFNTEDPFDPAQGGTVSAWGDTKQTYLDAIQTFSTAGVLNNANNHGGNVASTQADLVPDGVAIPSDSYWGHSVWQKIYEHLKSRQSRWVIDECFATGEEPRWNKLNGYASEGNWNGNSPLNMATIYGGWNLASANAANSASFNTPPPLAPNQTINHNSLPPTAVVAGTGNTFGLGHTTPGQFEYHSVGRGVDVANNTIDISYISPGQCGDANTFNYDEAWSGQTTNAQDSNNNFTNTGTAFQNAQNAWHPNGVAIWPQFFRISDPNNQNNFGVGVGADTIAQEAQDFENKLQSGAIIRFANDPNGILYEVTAVQRFQKWNYAESFKDSTYLLSDQAIYIQNSNTNLYQSGVLFFNDAGFNRRVTFRITLKCLSSPNAPIGTDGIGGGAFSGYNPLVGDNTNPTNINSATPSSCPIEILSADVFGDGEDVAFPENPAVFETEPKEQTGLNIFHEATDTIPLQIDASTIDDFIPIGSIADDKAGGFVKVLSINLASGNVNHFGAMDAYNIGDLIRYYRPDGFYTTAKVLQTFSNSGLLTLDLTSIKNNPVGLGWHNCYSFGNGVESDRIRDVFNSVTIDKGPKVSTTLEEGYEEEQRKYGLIYSGLYNSTSGLNNLNQFIQAEKITKDINPTYGSIQKLFTRNSDLLAFCEDKVLRILANKDAVFNADGNTQLTANNRVLGQTIPFSGEYGISTNPESFASESYRAYFTDKVRGAVMRLSKDGLTPISDAGMKDYFRDNLKDNNKLIGSYDDKKDEYNITLPDTQRDGSTGVTVSFNEKVRGWVSFKSFVPQNAISCANEYFTVYNGGIWMHHVESKPRNTFYNTHGPNDYSSVTVLLNQSPDVVKSFKTINYEGSKSKVDIFTTDVTTGLTDGQYYNLSASDGWYLESLFTDKENGHISEFIEKEGKWFNYIKGESIQHNQDSSILINNDGSSSFDHSSFAIQGLGIFEDTNI